MFGIGISNQALPANDQKNLGSTARPKYTTHVDSGPDARSNFQDCPRNVPKLSRIIRIMFQPCSIRARIQDLRVARDSLPKNLGFWIRAPSNNHWDASGVHWIRDSLGKATFSMNLGLGHESQNIQMFRGAVQTSKSRTSLARYHIHG